MSKNTWVIIPAYNEEKYLSQVLQKLKQAWPNFVVVNDGSSDQTASIAKQYTDHVISHSLNLGKGAALKTGSEYAFTHLNASGVIFFDADDQHDHRLIGHMAAELQHNPVVFGVRAFNNEMPLWRILFNRLASLMTLLFFGQYIPDIPSGFKALSKQAYKKIDWKANDYSVEMEIAARVAQYKIPFSTIQIPTIYHDLERGMTILDIIHVLQNIIIWKVSK